MTSIAASLEIDGRLDYAVTILPNASHHAVIMLDEACSLLGGPSTLAAVLRGLAAAAAQASHPPRMVWSGPTYAGDSDHTTAAVAHLIDEATEDVFASTYSASIDSPFVHALWRAIARGVSVTVLVDSTKMAGTAGMLMKKLQGAQFLTYVPPRGVYGVQHSKVVIVDSSMALITSANLSEAASNRNLEAGVLIRNAEFASKMRQRFSSILRAGSLTLL